MTTQTADKIQLFNSGHTACSGCGLALAARMVLQATGPKVIIVNATGCLEVFTTRSPQTEWGVAWMHSLFENQAAVATGVEAALRAQGRSDEARVIAWGGDGASADIGFGGISGMCERYDDVLYICYDNEAYMNTGIQRSGLTPFKGHTSTSPAGKVSHGNLKQKKNIPEIAVAHGIPYVATATVGYPKDLERKVKKAMEIRGPRYIQILVPCPLGWGHPTAETITMSKLAVETGLSPMFEYENGVLTSAMTVKQKPVEEYLKPQARFKHLFKDASGAEELKMIQEIANKNFAKYKVAPAK